MLRACVTEQASYTPLVCVSLALLMLNLKCYVHLFCSKDEIKEWDKLKPVFVLIDYLSVFYENNCKLP